MTQPPGPAQPPPGSMSPTSSYPPRFSADGGEPGAAVPADGGQPGAPPRSSNPSQPVGVNQPPVPGPVGPVPGPRSAPPPAFPQPVPGAPVPAYRPSAGGRNRKLGISLVAIILGGVALAIALAMVALQNPVIVLITFLPAMVVLAGAVAVYLWLDRWEPEPWQWLLFAFLWGGGVTIVSVTILQIVEAILGLAPSDEGLVRVQAPVTEELFKGLFLFLMATGLRRREMNSLTDYLVYAGFVGLGFAFVEDLLYFARAESIGQLIIIFVVRMLLSIFAHPLFTTMTAIGLYVGSKHTGTARWLWGLGGLLVAMACHGLWNNSDLFGGFFVAYPLIMVPLFAVVVVVAIRARRNDGRALARQLPAMVTSGLVGATEAAWLGNLSGRSARIRQARGLAGPDATAALRRYVDGVTELAFVRARLDAGNHTEQRLADHARLVAQVARERVDAQPALAVIAGQPLTTTQLTPPPT